MAALLGAGLTACDGKTPVDTDDPPAEESHAIWAMAGGNGQRQSRSALTASFPARQDWLFDPGGWVKHGPGFGPDGTIYLAQGDVLAAIDPMGKDVWRYDAESEIVAPPYVADGLVWLVCTDAPPPPPEEPDVNLPAAIVSAPHTGSTRSLRLANALSGDGLILALDFDGHPVHEYVLEGMVPRRAVVTGSGNFAIVARTRDDLVLLGVDLNGQVLWQAELGDLTNLESMAARGSRIYYTSHELLYVYEEGGTELAHFEVPRFDSGSFTIDSQGRIIVLDTSEYDDSWVGIRVLTALGTLVWEWEAVDGHGEMPLLHVGPADQLYFSTGWDDLTVLSSAGELLFTVPDVGAILGVAPDGTAITCDFDDYFLTAREISPAGEIIRELPAFPRIYDTYGGHPDYLDRGPVLFGPTGQIYSMASLQYEDNYIPPGLKVFNADGELVFVRSSSAGCSAPVVDEDGTAYVVSSSNLMAVSPDGELKWQTSVNGYFDSAPVMLGDDLIVILTGRHNLCAYNRNGLLVWRTRLGGYDSPELLAAVGDRVYVSFHHLLHCVSADGELLYMYPADTFTESGVAVGPDGTAYFMDYHGVIYAVDSTGQELWRSNTTANIGWAYPVVAGEDLILFPARGGMLALDRNGNELWRAIVEEGATTDAPAIGRDGTIYLPVDFQGPITNCWLYAFNPTGLAKWSVELEGYPSQPVVDGTGQILVPLFDRRLMIFDAAGTEVYPAGEPDPYSFRDVGSMCLVPEGGMLLTTPEGLAHLAP